MSDIAQSTEAQEYEALLQFLYMAPVGLVQLATDGTILMLNPLSAQLLMPLTRDGELTNLFDALAPVAPDLRLLCSQFSAPCGQVCDATRLYLHADGSGSVPQVLSLSMLKLDAERLMAVLTDISLQDRRERQLRKTDAWLNAIMTNITDYALVSLDRQGRVESWNESIGRVTGYAPGIKGQPYSLFYPAGATTPEQLLDRLREANENGWALDEGLCLRADGGQFWGSAMISPLPGRDEPAGPGQPSDEEPAYCMIIRDISDKRDASENLRKAAYCDHLTGLSNRRAFFEAADLELLRRKKALRPVSLIMLDADHFKAINDQYGHPAGDAVLCQLAATMRAVCRQVDVLARIGGEEFAVILPSVDQADALAVAERLRSQVQQVPTVYEKHVIAYTVSIGVAVMDDGLAGFDGLMKRADQALYAAKRRGRNQVAFWDPAAPDLSMPQSGGNNER
jgi:diguanylate cyclase (GGDEF)-like protein/PAS domain S-box-containing protein